MVAIICGIVEVIGMIAVALISKSTNKKADKISVIKDELKQEIDKVASKIDINQKDYLRFQILSFAGDLRNGIVKTRQEFETIFLFYDNYEMILENLNQPNRIFRK